MTAADDFSPIADQGTIEGGRGILGRWRRRADLTPVGYGFERVFVDDDGKVTGGRNISAGEKYWAHGSAWVTVDVSAHQLTYELPVADRTGKAGYVVTVTVSAQVKDGREQDVVRERAGKVRPMLLPGIQEMVASGIRGATAEGPPAIGPAGPPADIGLETGDELSGMRQAIEDRLRSQHVGKPVPAPDWLATSVSSLSVAFDQTTAKHVQALIEQARAGVIEVRAAAQKIALREKWRDHLFEHMAQGPARAIEVVLDNPTPEAIQAAVLQLNAAESEKRDDMRSVLELMIDHKLVDDVRDVEQWQAVKAITEALLPEGTQASGAPALGAGSSQSPRRRPGRDGDVIDAVAETAEHGTVGDGDGVPADRNWNSE
jgi:hypothetical protein